MQLVRLGLGGGPCRCPERPAPLGGRFRRRLRTTVSKVSKGIGAVVDASAARPRLEQDALPSRRWVNSATPSRLGRCGAGRQLAQNAAGRSSRLTHVAARCDAPTAGRSCAAACRVGQIISGSPGGDRLIPADAAAARGADRGDGVEGFPQGVELAMRRQDQRDVLGDAQIGRADGDAWPSFATPLQGKPGSNTTPLPITASFEGRNAGRQ